MTAFALPSLSSSLNKRPATVTCSALPESPTAQVSRRALLAAAVAAVSAAAVSASPDAAQAFGMPSMPSVSLPSVNLPDINLPGGGSDDSGAKPQTPGIGGFADEEAAGAADALEAKLAARRAEKKAAASSAATAE